MRHTMIVAAALALTAALATACSSSGEGQVGYGSTSTAPKPPLLSLISQTPAAPGVPAKSQRNNVVKRVGESSGIGRAGEQPVVSWTVTSVTVDPTCTKSIAELPENGHFVVVTMEAETSPAFEYAALPGGFHPMNNWAIVDADGVSQPHPSTTAATHCLDLDFPPQLAPGSRYSFHLVFDSRTPTGVLTFVPTLGAGGWEWSF
ncbi:hypothetical protein [Nocardia wallacei]|uniref:hypothetical protein n=1 Tax=Nocardia wallacei TaxID=480035 RepID=UPI002453841F|nr:hypothetical protein [Nocardia wallacei]